MISEKYDNVYVIHIVRDPRTFVRSYMNWVHSRFKSWVANKLVVGWHPSGYFTQEVPWRTWRRMDEFQRICWHWAYKNALLEDLFEGHKRYLRVRFEDLFLLKHDRALRRMLSFVGIPYQERFGMLCRQRTNASPSTWFPAWEAWEPQRKRQLLDICGQRMKAYGYPVGYEA
jgi:hypothetical protein